MNISTKPLIVQDALEKINLTACPLCGSELYDILVNGNDFEFNTGKYRVQRCRSCQLGYTNPVIGEKDLYRFYAERNTPDFPNSTGIIQTLRHWYLVQQARRTLNEMSLSGPISIMDYGCGDGAYSLALSTLPECKVVASDFHDDPPYLLVNAIKNSHKIKYISYRSLNEEESFDVVFCRQVLEHIPNPLHLLSELHRRLSPSGFLVIEVPNIDSFWRNLLGKYYYPLHLPQHFYHFNVKSLSLLVEKESFVVRRVTKLHAPALPKSIQYLTGIKLANIGYLGLFSFPFSILMDLISGESTTLRLLCQKV